jgi:hypothetical protein
MHAETEEGEGLQWPRPPSNFLRKKIYKGKKIKNKKLL